MEEQETSRRVFVDTVATREHIPLLISNVGPSGGGKTMSALRLAVGVQRITGGDIFMIDTESGRGLHYADKFKYRHVSFGAPFSPLDYLAAIEHCAKRGAKVVIIDSMSHEHEGPGGVLEWHDAEVQRLSGGDSAKAERVKMGAWAKPKAARRRMINTVLQLNVALICNFRARPKLKIITGKPPVPQGWMPIAGEEFMYEMMVNCLLPPRADGVPDWTPVEPAEREMYKLPAQFRDLFTANPTLSEDIGEAMAKWAEGGEVSLMDTIACEIQTADDGVLKKIGPRIAQAFKGGKLNEAEARALSLTFDTRREVLSLNGAAPVAGANNGPASVGAEV